jgi:2-polyprenyl-3-methyl-5-hydroxy-6-metoxy-1,4-benzoquinol methylase
MTTTLADRDQNLSKLSSCRYETEIVADPYNRNWLLLEWVGTNKTVLELGCSTGYFSRILAQRNCSVIGVEVDQDAAKRAKEFCPTVLVRDLNRTDWTADLNQHPFDAVLIGDVLEHLLDPEAVLRQVRPLLRSSGSVIISLPNVVHWLTRLKLLLGHFDYEPSGTLDYTHIRFFTLKTARKLLENAGYKVTKFHPAIGGRMSGHARPVWQRLAHLFPGLFAYQFLFEARSEGCEDSQLA